MNAKGGASVGVVVTSQHLGGAERYLLDLYAGLRNHGVFGTLLGTLPGWRDTGSPAIDVGMGPKWSRRGMTTTMLRTPRETVEALRLIREAHAQCPFTRFHAQFKREQIMLTSQLSKLAPVVWTEHGRFARHRGAATLHRAYRIAARRTEQIICVSKEVADDVSRIVDSDTKLAVIDNAVDESIFHPPADHAEIESRRRLRHSLGITDREVLAVVAARLHPAKDLGRAIAASQAAGIKLVIAGDGPDRQRLRAMSTEAVTFVGHQSRHELAGWLRAGDLLLYCALPNEGSPLTVLEAAASGLALVSVAPPPDDPGTRYVVEGGGVALQVPESLAGWLAHADLRELGRQARALAERHLLPAWLERHREILTAS